MKLRVLPSILISIGLLTGAVTAAQAATTDKAEATTKKTCKAIRRRLQKKGLRRITGVMAIDHHLRRMIRATRPDRIRRTAAIPASPRNRTSRKRMSGPKNPVNPQVS